MNGSKMSEYCEHTHCTRQVLRPNIYCDKHVDKASNPNMMTGQEFYDRYKKLSDENAETVVPKKPDGSFDYKLFGEMLAKKAAGLDVD